MIPVVTLFVVGAEAVVHTIYTKNTVTINY